MEPFEAVLFVDTLISTGILLDSGVSVVCIDIVFRFCLITVEGMSLTLWLVVLFLLI